MWMMDTRAEIGKRAVHFSLIFGQKNGGFVEIFVDKASRGVVKLCYVKSRKAGQNAVIS
jgi:hypothetical protein